MITDDQLMGIRKKDMNELKEIKVKLPVRHLVNLHYLKLTSDQGISELVNEALGKYFAAIQLPTSMAGPGPAPSGV